MNFCLTYLILLFIKFQDDFPDASELAELEINLNKLTVEDEEEEEEEVKVPVKGKKADKKLSAKDKKKMQKQVCIFKCLLE